MNIERILNWAAMILLPIVLFQVSLYWTSNFKDDKERQYEKVSNVHVNKFGFTEDGWPGSKVLYIKKIIDTGRFVLLCIENTRIIPLNSAGFEKAITIKFDNKSVVIGLRKTSSTPDGLS